ncbi:MAG TPA: helix-turn-helix domain-containing protein [Verrucomicrobiales bacterium]|jgi:excisionase family DNA binding protein|nr:helix-turn-helix domain-containing protein [Verrucomicrobiales bacterium]
MNMTHNDTPLTESAGELLTIVEACALLKIKRRTIDDWRASRALPCIKRGKYVRFRRADVEAFLAAHTVTKREGN